MSNTLCFAILLLWAISIFGQAGKPHVITFDYPATGVTAYSQKTETD